MVIHTVCEYHGISVINTNDSMYNIAVDLTGIHIIKYIPKCFRHISPSCKSLPSHKCICNIVFLHASSGRFVTIKNFQTLKKSQKRLTLLAINNVLDQLTYYMYLQLDSSQ